MPTVANVQFLTNWCSTQIRHLDEVNHLHASLIIDRIVTVTVVTHIGFCFTVKSSTQHMSPTFTTDRTYPFFSLLFLNGSQHTRHGHSSSSSSDSSQDSTVVFAPRFDFGLSLDLGLDVTVSVSAWCFDPVWRFETAIPFLTFATGDLLCKNLLYGESVRIVEDCPLRRLQGLDVACGNAYSSDTDTRERDVEGRESDVTNQPWQL